MAEEPITAPQTTENIISVKLEDNITKMFKIYADDIIHNRALPAIEDGLKPVQRRILFSMHKNKLFSGAKTRKSATVVGHVLGNYHAHGDQSVYDALVKLAQPWSKRYPLTYIHGNLGSIDGDGPAAMRYTECRMSNIGNTMTTLLENNTVNMLPNYDNTTTEPEYLPAIIPNLLLNGTTGIAAGVATSMAPHYAKDVFKALDYVLDCFINGIKPDEDCVISIIKAPDFPTGGTIINANEMSKIYKAGKGVVVIRANYTIEQKKNKTSIVFNEIPYMVSKSKIVESIATFMASESKVASFISDIKDESGKGQIRIVVDVKRGCNADLLLHALFKKTQLQNSFSINNTYLYNNEPCIHPSLLQIISQHLLFASKVVAKNEQFHLKKAAAKMHILQGIKACLNNLDKTISIIRTADDVNTELMKEFTLDEEQAQAVRSNRLDSLSKASIAKLADNIAESEQIIAKCTNILSSKENIFKELKRLLPIYLNECSPKDDIRRTKLANCNTTISEKDTIVPENIIVLYTLSGFIKAVKVDEYNVQKRAGKGASTTKSDLDPVIKAINCSTVDTLCIYTADGMCYTFEAYELGISSKTATGKQLFNYIQSDLVAPVVEIMAVPRNDKSGSLFLATANGMAKRLSFESIPKRNSNGFRCISIVEQDRLITVSVIHDDEQIVMISNNGKALRFNAVDLRIMSGKNAMGVRTMNVGADNHLVGAFAIKEHNYLVCVDEEGHGKRIEAQSIRLCARRSKGVLIQNVKHQIVATTILAASDNDIMMITKQGKAIRIKSEDFPAVKIRTSVGNRVINLEQDDIISTMITLPRESKDISK